MDRHAATINQTINQTIGRVALGASLVGAGIGHFSFARTEFRAQVPRWVPMNEDTVVLLSGAVEVLLGLALLVLPRRWRPMVGVIAAGFFIAVFPGNIAQWRQGVDAFGLDSDLKRAVRLLFQPALVVLALWSTGGWLWLRRSARR
ncbi:MAG: hypothetical protein ACKV2O_24185 [Acidimicrobiales bacterium]